MPERMPKIVVKVQRLAKLFENGPETESCHAVLRSASLLTTLTFMC